MTAPAAPESAPKRRGTVTATPYDGLKPLASHAVTYDGPDQPPEDAVVGECVGEAVRSAWGSGFDPALHPFSVVVTFGVSEEPPHVPV